VGKHHETTVHGVAGSERGHGSVFTGSCQLPDLSECGHTEFGRTGTDGSGRKGTEVIPMLKKSPLVS